MRVEGLIMQSMLSSFEGMVGPEDRLSHWCCVENSGLTSLACISRGGETAIKLGTKPQSGDLPSLSNSILGLWFSFSHSMTCVSEALEMSPPRGCLPHSLLTFLGVEVGGDLVSLPNGQAEKSLWPGHGEQGTAPFLYANHSSDLGTYLGPSFSLLRS